MISRLAIPIALCGALFAQDRRPDNDAWRALRFLIGRWEANTKGGSAGASGAGDYSFGLELRDHVLARHSGYSECKGPADFDCAHGDLLYVYAESGRLRAIYFDNEGHVIHYDVTTHDGGTGPDSRTAVFLSPPSEPGPQYRLTYELRAQVMSGKFEIRAPGQKEFRAYLEWSGGKKK